MASSKPQSRGHPRPVRSLVFLLVVIVAMYAAMFLTGNTTPRLGLDLQGGTSVILQPRATEGGDVSQEQVDQAVNIIRQRVDGLGVTEAEVQTQGTNIVVSLPGATSREAVDLVGQTAQLRFRPVLTAASGAPAPATPTPGIAEGTGVPPATDPATPAETTQAPPVETAPTTPAPTEAPSPAVEQQRVVPSSLLAHAANAQEPTAPAAEQAPETPVPEQAPATPATPQDVAAAIPPELQQQFIALDCSRPENRQGGDELPTDQPVVACDQDGVEKFLLGPTAVEGTNVDDAQAGLRPGTNEWIVTLDFDNTGTQQFSQTTQSLVSQPPPQNRFAIVLDGVVVSAPAVQSAITGGQAEIFGDFTQEEAQNLANVLRYGALPLSFDQGEVNTISPTVGSDQLNAGLLAGIVGLIAVAIYSLLFYRALGIVSILSLTVAGLLTYASVVLLGVVIGFTLILAGVIGVIVAIGITADSFVVYFERVRDEIREGTSIRLAAERGWVRARRTILIADAVTFLAAVVLYVLAIGRVQNFAFTLGLTTLIDIVVVFLFTKPLTTLLVRGKFFGRGHPLSGLNPDRVGASPPAPLRGRRRSTRPAGPRPASVSRGEA